MVKEELINYYLNNNNFGNIWLVEEAINELNICSYEPNDLPPSSKIKSNDLVWYFFSPNAKKTIMKKTTSSEFWKPTVKDLVGYRFSPTTEELINYYLKNKILGKSWLVDDAISEINICSYKPMFLPFLSKIKSDNLKWYFFSPKKRTMKRTTGSGFWKRIVKDRIIKDRRGSNSKIGIKKKLVYHEGKIGNGVRTSWIMHEYHITCLPPNLTTHVLCQVKYKGEDGHILYGACDSLDTFED